MCYSMQNESVGFRCFVPGYTLCFCYGSSHGKKPQLFSLLPPLGWGAWQDGALQEPGSLPFPSEPFPELRNLPGGFSAAAEFPQKGPLLTNHLLPAMICSNFKKLIKNVSNQ